MRHPVALIILLIVWGLAAPARARQTVDLLQTLSDDLAARADREDAQAAGWSGLRSAPSRELPDGRHVALVRVRDGRPVFYQTHNAAAGRTIRVQRVRSEGGLGLNLTGDGWTAGLWDAGAARSTHVEFVGRITQQDLFVQVTGHASHVAGTMIASGVDPKARGIAPQAFVDSYDWNNDEVEMANAASAGLRLSSHSYGTLGGWSFDVRGDGRWAWMGDPSVHASEDFRFGYYDDQARTWDQIAQLSPDYLIVKSVGNERSDRGPRPGEIYSVYHGSWSMSTLPRRPDGGDSGYDTVLDAGNAKNVLTVGAVDDLLGAYRGPEDVIMTTFSGFGPTDDGRIKPELVANGIQVLSSVAWADDAYATSSGSSMAAPAVAGAALLLRELQASIHPDSPLSSASLRAILIHAADEAGTTPGPDYRFGFGLVNVGRSAEVLQQGRLTTDRLVEGTTYSMELELEPGDPIRITLAWTDPAGEVSEPTLNDRTPRLVNDLDLWVDGPDGPRLPWVLDPTRPGAGATVRRNAVDNIEQVVAVADQGGVYTVFVGHRGPLSGASQAFSLVVGDPPPPEAGLASVLGRATLQGQGIPNMPIQLSGPVSAETTTTTDGTYGFDAVPPGAYSVRIWSDVYRFIEQHDSLVISGGTVRADFVAEPAATLIATTAFSSPRLLQKGETDRATRVTTLAAGGMYGVTLTFSSDFADRLIGGQVALDFEYDERVAPYAGLPADRLSASGASWPLVPAGPGWVEKRIPVIWTAPDTPAGYAGYAARIPFTVRGSDGRPMLVDTLAFTIDRPDDVPPVLFALDLYPGRGVIPPGSSGVIEASVLDGSRALRVEALVLNRDDPTEIVARLELKDNGNLSTHADRVAGNSVFSGFFNPGVEGDFRVLFEASDVSGNDSERIPSALHFTNRPFETHADLLLLSWSPEQSETDVQRAALRELGVPFDYWEFEVRGRIPADVLERYPVVIWNMHRAALDRAEDRSLISELSQRGSRLLFLSENLPGEDPAWTHRTLGAAPAGTVDAGAAVSGLQDAWSGFHFTLRDDSRPILLAPVSGAETILVTAGRASAVRHDGGVTAAFSAASVSEPSRTAYALGWLLYATTGDGAHAPLPDVPSHIAPADQSTLADSTVVMMWSPQPFSTFEVALFEDADTTSAPSRTLVVADSEAALARLRPGTTYGWRVRATNPRGVGPWSSLGVFSVALQTALERRDPSLPGDFALGPAYPNPFSDRVTIPLDVAEAADVRLEVFSLDGARIALLVSERMPPGRYTATWRADAVPAGLYLCRMTVGSATFVRSLVRVR